MTAYVFDTETTDREDGEIIEAALFRFTVDEDIAGASDRIVLDMNRRLPPQATRYRPAKPMTMGSLAVHHILPSELEDCPPSASFALPDDCEYLVGHSVDFDWKAAGSPPNVRRICTHTMAQWVWPDATGYSLVALTYMTQGATAATRSLVQGAHGADVDVILAYYLLVEILKLRPEITTWSALWRFSEECRIPRTCPIGKYRGVPLTELDEGFIGWCLRQDWLDPYFRTGLERELERRSEGLFA